MRVFLSGSGSYDYDFVEREMPPYLLVGPMARGSIYVRALGTQVYTLIVRIGE